jgi:hypothetical protein
VSWQTFAREKLGRQIEATVVKSAPQQQTEGEAQPFEYVGSTRRAA